MVSEVFDKDSSILQAVTWTGGGLDVCWPSTTCPLHAQPALRHKIKQYLLLFKIYFLLALVFQGLNQMLIIHNT